MYFVPLATLFIGFVCAQAAEVSQQDALAAVVGDTVITMNQVSKRLHYLLPRLAVIEQFQQNRDPSNPAITPEMVRMGLEHMIAGQLQLNVAKRAGVNLTADEKTKVLEHVASSMKMSVSEMTTMLQREGENPHDFYQMQYDEALVHKIQHMVLAGQVSISDGEIQDKKAQAEANLTEYFVEDIVYEKISTQENLEASKTSAKALAQSWPTSAFNKWNVPKGTRMIQFKWKKLLEFPEVFQDKVAQLKEKECARPFVTESGVHVVKLIRKRLSTSLPTDQQLKDALYADKMQSEVKKWITDLREQQYVMISDVMTSQINFMQKQVQSVDEVSN